MELKQQRKMEEKARKEAERLAKWEARAAKESQKMAELRREERLEWLKVNMRHSTPKLAPALNSFKLALELHSQMSLQRQLE